MAFSSSLRATKRGIGRVHDHAVLHADRPDQMPLVRGANDATVVSTPQCGRVDHVPLIVGPQAAAPARANCRRHPIQTAPPKPPRSRHVPTRRDRWRSTSSAEIPAASVCVFIRRSERFPQRRQTPCDVRLLVARKPAESHPPARQKSRNSNNNSPAREMPPPSRGPVFRGTRRRGYAPSGPAVNGFAPFDISKSRRGKCGGHAEQHKRFGSIFDNGDRALHRLLKQPRWGESHDRPERPASPRRGLAATDEWRPNRCREPCSARTVRRRMFARGTSVNCSAVASAWTALVTIQVRSGRINGALRATVCCNIVASPANGRSCLGSVLRLCGQNRVPLPPAITTACSTFAILSTNETPVTGCHWLCQCDIQFV